MWRFKGLSSADQLCPTAFHTATGPSPASAFLEHRWPINQSWQRNTAVTEGSSEAWQYHEGRKVNVIFCCLFRTKPYSWMLHAGVTFCGLYEVNDDRVSLQWAAHSVARWIRAFVGWTKVAQHVFFVWSPISCIILIIWNKVNWLLSNLKNSNRKMVRTKGWLLLKVEYGVVVSHFFWVVEGTDRHRQNSVLIKQSDFTLFCHSVPLSYYNTKILFPFC